MNVATLDLQSEPYGSTGNIGGNLRRVMGTPTHDPLRTAIREALQNIADAAKLGRGPELTIRVRRLSPDQVRILRESTFHSLPECPESKGAIEDAIGRDDHTVLEFCDFGTTGLGGPTRANRMPEGTTSTDFVDFVRNVGSQRDTEQGGGTYGFGKMALYGVSRCSTIIVDSQPAGMSADGRRLIACHVGNSYTQLEDGYQHPYTGRHWWGRACASDGIVDPLSGADAAEMADLLGLPQRTAAQTGTSIMILDLENDGRDMTALGTYIAETVLWNFWPRLMHDVPDSRRFKCRLEVDGCEVTIPDPESVPQLELFCKAMRAARTGAGDNVQAIRCQRPKLRLGSLAIEKGLRVERSAPESEETVFPSVCHHVALMRPVELVVKYLPGNAYPDERVEWAGVFLASEEKEVEEAFALSEPPAHDDWIPEGMSQRRQKTIVNVALREIKSAIAEVGAPRHQRPADAAGPSLAGVADRLGSLLSSVEGDAPSRPSGSGGARGPGGGRKARATRPVFVALREVRGTRVARFRTTVTQDSGRSGTHLKASAHVAVDNGAKASLDDGEAMKPEVLGIGTPDGALKVRGDCLHIDGRSGEFDIVVAIPGEVAVMAEAELLTEQGS